MNVMSDINQFLLKNHYFHPVRVVKRENIEECFTISKNVAIKAEINQSSHKMTLCLWSVTLDRVLNSKEKAQPSFQIKSEELEKNIKYWLELFKSQEHYYETQLHMSAEELIKYKVTLSMKIQSIPNWQEKDFLKSNLDKVNKGFVLSPKTIIAIDKFMQNKKQNTELTPEQKTFYDRIVSLSQASKENNDEWTISFSQSLIDAIQKYGVNTRLTDRQKQILLDKFNKYHI